MTIGQFDQICDVLLLKIFSFLDGSAKICCRSVCCRWRRVASDWRLWKEVDIAAIIAAKEDGKTYSGSRGIKTRALSTPVSCLIPNGLLLGVPLSDRVCSVSLRGTQLNVSTLESLAQACPCLTELDISEAFVCDTDCFHVRHHAQDYRPHGRRFTSSLRSISLRSTNLPSSLLVDLWELASDARLTKLDVRAIKPRCGGGRLQCRMQLQLLLSSCRDVQLLDISECSWVTDRALADILAQTDLPELRSLSMSNCKHFTGSSLCKLLQKCPKLTSLDLSGTSLSCQELVRIEPLVWHQTSLQSLDLSGCTLTPSAVDRTIQPLSGSLRHLAMNRWAKSTGPVLLKESFRSIVTVVRCGVLQSLALDGHGLCSEQVSSLCNANPCQLQQLLLGLQVDVPLEKAVELLSSCKQLTDLTLHFSSGLNAANWSSSARNRLSSLHRTSKLKTLTVRGPDKPSTARMPNCMLANINTQLASLRPREKGKSLVKSSSETVNCVKTPTALAQKTPSDGGAQGSIATQHKALKAFARDLQSVLTSLDQIQLIGWTQTQ